MRIAVVKPDWGIRGGFEIVLDRIAGHLTAGGHDVREVAVPVGSVGNRPFGLEIPEPVRARVPQLVSYLAQVEAFRDLDLHRAELVISTQPPSFVVDHPRHLSVFFHHARQFYDLAAANTAAGTVDPELHPLACDVVRSVDAPCLAAVTHFLAGSETVRDRLARFNGRRDGVSLFHAGAGHLAIDPPAFDPSSRLVVCVSRHEFPKRTELFVQALSLLPDHHGVSVGSGGRQGAVMDLDRRLRLGEPVDPAAALAAAPWIPVDQVPPHDSNVAFAGRVDDDRLARLLGEALCVVAPAYEEDYGLTAIEAMSYGRPVVVCRDGGHLAQLVEHERTGLTVEPTGAAIAEAVRRLTADPDLARRLGAAGREVAAGFTWERAFAQLDHGVERVMS